jgi:serine/threonine protein kinase
MQWTRITFLALALIAPLATFAKDPIRDSTAPGVNAMQETAPQRAGKPAVPHVSPGGSAPESPWTSDGIPAGYRKVSSLGEGTFAKAFLVQEQATGKFRVLKVANAASEKMGNTFKREHSLLVEAGYAAGDETQLHKNPDSGIYAITMPTIFESSQSNILAVPLGTILNAHNGNNVDALPNEYRITPKNLIAWQKSIDEAVGRLHARGIFHNDLHPQNVLMSWDDAGQPVAHLIDFGLASRASETEHPRGAILFQSAAKLSGDVNDPAASDLYGAKLLKALIHAEAHSEDHDELIYIRGKGMVPLPATAAAVIRAEHGTAFKAPAMSVREKREFCDSHYEALHGFSPAPILRAIANIRR